MRYFWLLFFTLASSHASSAGELYFSGNCITCHHPTKTISAPSVVEFKKRFYPSKWANYDLINLGNIILVPNEKAIKIFEKDYQSMKNMIFGDVPKFSEIINTIGKYELELNNLIKQKLNNR